MNYTEKYHLPQWEESDRVMRSDFNQMCADIESGIDGAKAQAAQSDAALEVKIAKAAELPYVLGTYQGNGSTKKITTGFPPSAVFFALPSLNASGMPVILSKESQVNVITFENDGFSVHYATSSFYEINASASHYLYIALR